jgi:tetratricopeptide (TPR) repeat protein
MSKTGESKTVKQALKEARDLIAKKDHKSALRCCKRALNVDKTNYMALVFCGLCLSELDQPDQSLQAYKKATEASPEQLTAWQGLASFYEKQKEPKKEDLIHLTKVYQKLLEFMANANEMDKYLITSDKLVNIHVSKLQQIASAVKVLQERIKVCNEKGKEDKAYYGRTDIVKILSQSPHITDEESQLLKETLYSVISDTSTAIQNSEHLKIMIRLLYRNRDMEELIQVAFKMNKIFPESPYALEWICKVYLEYVTDTLDFKNEQLETSVEGHINKLLILSESSILAKLANAAFVWKIKDDFKATSELLNQVLDGSSNPNFYGLYILCQCHIKLRNLAKAEKSLTLALVLLEKVKEKSTRIKLETGLNYMLANVYYEQGKHEKVIELLERVPNQDPTLKQLLIKTFANLGARNKVEELSKDLDEKSSLIAMSMLCKAEGKLDQARQHLDQIQDRGSDFEAVLLQAQLDWESQNYEMSQLSFLLAAKSNPYSWIPFFYLGEYYRTYAGKPDLDRARKCYQKSVHLNPHSSEAGSALSDIFRSQVRHYKSLYIFDKYLIFL